MSSMVIVEKSEQEESSFSSQNNARNTNLIFIARKSTKLSKDQLQGEIYYAD